MNIESQSLAAEAKRIHWRREILEGKHGAKALARIIAMTAYGFPERFIT